MAPSINRLEKFFLGNTSIGGTKTPVALMQHTAVTVTSSALYVAFSTCFRSFGAKK